MIGAQPFVLINPLKHTRYTRLITSIKAKLNNSDNRTNTTTKGLIFQRMRENWTLNYFDNQIEYTEVVILFIIISDVN